MMGNSPRGTSWGEKELKSKKKKSVCFAGDHTIPEKMRF
jgi:hypothetical protein